MTAADRQHYSNLARELQQFPGCVIGVLYEPANAGRETPASLRFEDIAAACGAAARC